jgi:hypothetical protein
LALFSFFAGGTSGRIAPSTTGDDYAAKQTGFDAKPLVDSRRQTPSTPAYCTDLTLTKEASCPDTGRAERRAH